MGHRITQIILTCAICGVTPDNGEYMWEMCGDYWCEKCCNKEEGDEIDMDGFDGTYDKLNNLKVR